MNLSDEWAPGRRWRVIATRPDGHVGLWCETSDEVEARERLATVPDDWTDPRLERLWERNATEWRSA